MTPPEDPSFWMKLANYLWGLLVPAGWWMWKKQDDRLGKLEEAKASSADMIELKAAIHSMRANMVTSEQLKAHEESDRADRAERRDTEISLFNKVDELKDSINQRFDTIRDLIMNSRK